MQKLKIVLLFIGLLSNYCSAQKDIHSWDFYDYLRHNNLNRDALVWLNNYSDTTQNSEIKEKLYLEKATIFLAENRIDSANFYYKKVSAIFVDSSISAKALYAAFVEKDTASLKICFENNEKFRNNKEYFISYKILKRDSCLADSMMPESEFFQQLISAYSHHKKKSAFKAALLSSVIPGSGKFYLGYKHQARSALLINVVLGLVLAESLLIPVSTIYTGFCLTTSSVFYIGNIWGSAALAKKRDIDFYNQINENISDYYYHKLFP